MSSVHWPGFSLNGPPPTNVGDWIERLDHGAVVLATEWRARGAKDAAALDRAAANNTVTQLVTRSRVAVRGHGSGRS